MQEIIFEIAEDPIEGGYSASALGYGIHTQAETIDGLKSALREAVACHFDDEAVAPKMIRLHFVRDEVIPA